MEITLKVVNSRMEDHLQSKNLHDREQSAYRVHHSTETALLRVHHDITPALDKGSCVVLLMLDLFVAFDVIDHTIRVKYYGGSHNSFYFLITLTCGQI